VSNNSTEILFFITPHIYRPDYFGRPTSTVPAQGPRSTSVPQPVPLGNPQTNTPTPTELQQQEKNPTGPQTQPVQPATNPAGAARPGALGGGQKPQR
jgi:hypothetical protein